MLVCNRQEMKWELAEVLETVAEDMRSKLGEDYCFPPQLKLHSQLGPVGAARIALELVLVEIGKIVRMVEPGIAAEEETVFGIVGKQEPAVVEELWYTI